MKVSSLPNLNRETTSFPNFFTLFQHPADPDDNNTTLNKRPKTNDTEPSETSPFKGIPSTSLSSGDMNVNHLRIVGFFPEWDQMDRPPSPNGSDTNVSVGSNPFEDILSPLNSSEASEAMNEIGFLAGTNSVGLIRRESVQTLSNMSSVWSNWYSGDGSATGGSVGPNPTQLWWWDQSSHPDFPESEFRRAFKMSKSTFEFICSKLDPVINKEDSMLRLRPQGAHVCADDECEHVACRPVVDLLVGVFYASFGFQIPELVAHYQRHLLDILDKIAADDILVILSVLLTRCIENIVMSDVDIVTLGRTLPGHIVNRIVDSRKELGFHGPESSCFPDKHASLAKAEDDLRMVALYLEGRVALLKLLFRTEANVAMNVAQVDGTSELLSRMRALNKTVELGSFFFPRCSKVINDIVDHNDLSELFYIQNGTREECQLKNKRRYMEIQEAFTKAFHKDKEELDKSINISSSSRPLRGVGRPNGKEELDKSINISSSSRPVRGVGRPNGKLPLKK